MARSDFSRLVLAGALTLLAACSAVDQATAPAQNEARPVGAPSFDVIINSVAPDSSSVDFTVTPTGGLFAIGRHGVYFPANSICDPATSSYGPGTWDEPCTPLDRSIDLHAEVRTNDDGSTWVDFTPAIRFVPTDNSEQVVWMMMKTGVDVTADNYLKFGMLWMPNGTPDQLVNEAASDASLKTYVDVNRDVVFRRVKHFSGYLVGNATEDTVIETINEIIPIF